MFRKVSKYQFYKVPKSISYFVKNVWCFESLPNNGDYYIFRTYASVFPTMFFVQRGSVQAVGKGQGTVAVVGQTDSWNRFKTSNDFKIFGITFYPYSLPLLFDETASRLSNQVVDVTALQEFPALAHFHNALVQSNRTISNTAIDQLTTRINKVPATDRVVNQINENISARDIDLTGKAEKVFLSQRTFQRKFKYYTGYSPKAFSNVLRFSRALSSLFFESRTLSDTAFELRYFDQAHLSNSFKHSSGFQPKVFAKQANEQNVILHDFVDFFQFLSICPPVLCRNIIQHDDKKQTNGNLPLVR
jgi:AraC-like DNA-binding protein